MTSTSYPYQFILGDSPIEEFATIPSRFPIWRCKPLKFEGVRSFYVKSFNVFYTINEPPKNVIVLRVLYNRRDV